MALSKLESLYMAVIADHSKNPHHQGELEGQEPITLHNPTCGDVIKLSLLVKEDKVVDLAFTGHGCTISTASASMMGDAVIGKSVAEALDLAQHFSLMVQGEIEADEDRLGDAAFLAGVAKFPQRIKCATLAWNALKKGLE